MQPDKEQLEFILNEAGQFGTLDSARNVVFTNIPTPLDDSPEGWQDEDIQFMRNTAFFGIFRSMTAQFSFKKTAAKIMRWVYNTRGIQSIARLVLLQRDNVNMYQPVYHGKIDFSQKKDTEMGFNVNIMEGGLIEFIKANQATTYEIAIDAPEAITVNWTGVVMYSELTMTSYRDSQLGGSSGTEIVPINRNGRYIHLGLLTNQGETSYPSLVFNGFSSYIESGNLNDVKDDWGNDWDFRATSATTINFKNKIRFEHFGPVNFSINFFIYNETNGGSRSIFLTNTWVDGAASFDATFQMSAGEKAWLYFDNPDNTTWTFFRPSPDLFHPVDPNDTISMTYTFLKDPTLVKVLRALYVLEQLIRKMTDGIYGASSELLSELGIAYDFCLTMGDTIRGISGSSVKTSLEAFFKSYNTRFNTGLGTQNNQVAFEKKGHFYNDTNLADLGEVAEAEFEPYLEGMPNNIKIGWPNDSTEDVNGRQEFNNTFEWSTPITAQAKDLLLVAEYQAGCFVAERLRINLEGKTTTDDDNDNKVFMINIAPVKFNGSVAFANFGDEHRITLDAVFQSAFVGAQITITGSAGNNGVFNIIGVQQFPLNTVILVEELLLPEVANILLISNQAALNRPKYDDVQGLLSPETVFNMELRPGLCIRAHSDYLRAGLNKLETEYIKFQTTYKNRDLVVTSNGVTIAEKADILIASLPGKLWLPELVTTKVKVPLFITTLIDADPYGQLRFVWRGQEWWGFIIDAGQNPDFNKSQTYKLLLSTRNDLSRLITE